MSLPQNSCWAAAPNAVQHRGREGAKQMQEGTYDAAKKCGSQGVLLAGAASKQADFVSGRHV